MRTLVAKNWPLPLGPGAACGAECLTPSPLLGPPHPARVPALPCRNICAHCSEHFVGRTVFVQHFQKCTKGALLIFRAPTRSYACRCGLVTKGAAAHDDHLLVCMKSRYAFCSLLAPPALATAPRKEAPF